MVQGFDDRVPDNFEPAAQIIPERDAQFVARLGKTEECIAAVPADVAPRAGADRAPCDTAVPVILPLLSFLNQPEIVARGQRVKTHGSRRRNHVPGSIILGLPRGRRKPLTANTTRATSTGSARNWPNTLVYRSPFAGLSTLGRKAQRRKTAR